MSDRMAEEKLAMMQGEMDNLRQKVAFLEQKLKELQENRNIPRNPFDIPKVGSPGDCMPYPTKFEYKKECTQCGIKFGDGPIGYYCPQKNCPCGLGSPWCGMPTL